MDPRLVSYGAAFWGWTEEETEEMLHTSPNNVKSEGEEEDAEAIARMQEAAFNDQKESPCVTPHHPTCVVFHHHGKNRKPRDSDDGVVRKKKGIKEYTAFMSATPAKILASWNMDCKKQLDNDNDDNEKLLLKQDKELKDLIESSKLIEEYAAEELVGKSRQHYQMQKLVELGMKPLKKQPVEQKTNMKILDRTKKEMAKAKTLVQHMGLHTTQAPEMQFLAERYSNKTKKTFDTSLSFAAFRKKSSRKRAHVPRDQGIHGSIGRFKDGMLQVRKQDIRNVERRTKKMEHLKEKRKRRPQKK